MPSITEKTHTLRGCRLGPTAIRQLARIAVEGLEGPRTYFSHTHDGTKYEAETLDALVESIADSPIVTDMSNCSNLTIQVIGDYPESRYFRLTPETVHLNFKGADRANILGQFETALGYLKGHGADGRSVVSILRPSFLVIVLGAVLQLLIVGIGGGGLGYSISGLIVTAAFTFAGFRMRAVAMERQKNLINCLNEPSLFSTGWSSLSVTNKIAVVTTVFAGIAALAAVTTAVSDWVSPK